MAGIYIHIPFCKQACHYCNFLFSTSLVNKDKFIKSLLKEIALSKDYLNPRIIETIYIGGGTPSLLPLNDLLLVLQTLAAHYDLRGLNEFTLEANPDDLTQDKITALNALKPFGLNRLSIGVQSFFDEDLQYMNRVHNSNEAISSIKRVQDAGFENITLDLIYGTPSMPDEHWRKNLETAFALNIPHISSYALTVEAKTTLERRIAKRESKPVDEEQSARQFQILMDEMKKAGYEQYEISNFAKPGKYAIHNTNYWRGKEYLGLGPSAHSFNRAARRWNVSNNISYINAINAGQLPYEEETLTVAQKVNEKIMTSLRTQWGLNISDCGIRSAELIQNSLQQIDVSFYTFENGILKLTDKGKLFADSIASQLFIDEEQILNSPA
jgi:oxygen-independent coproporphyrinogen-3 oxidase